MKISRDGLVSFTVPKKLVDVANQLSKTDPYEVRETLSDAPIERATVDKEVAQRTLGCRLLRFGDAAFEAMVRHVQHGGFADGVASLELPAASLGWAVGTEGTWLLFDLRIIRQEGFLGGARVLRHELASFVVPRGAAPVAADRVVESLQDGLDGPANVDQQEAKRAYAAAREAADARLATMYQELVAEYGTKEAILPQEVQDVALAWVCAS